MQVPGGNSVYERWVNSLRAWAKDPENVSLLELPVLEESTFTPDTYRRLVSHILDAMRQANERWHQGLTRAWTNATTPYELSREMVSLRTTLARRVQLARHPGLPEPIQAALLERPPGGYREVPTGSRDRRAHPAVGRLGGRHLE